ncbi:MAG TPA: hypothetical protein VKA48_02790 [Gammaproteobacteria bacterium]|nr:hypothetical protein [Gammaproteobacteria bacterium]
MRGWYVLAAFSLGLLVYTTIYAFMMPDMALAELAGILTLWIIWGILDTWWSDSGERKPSGEAQGRGG